ncbi:MAG: DNA gyrase inhibitor YacG [bacterium]|nr:DNA gyrase inhibitor YacG [bacterium]
MPTYTCPTCHKDVHVAKPDQLASRPFCTTRCRLIDLGKWLNEEYRISEPLESTSTPPDEPSDSGADLSS